MGLKGSYDYKGITISDAYLQIDNLTCYMESTPVQTLKTAEVLNEDGSLNTPAVFTTTFTKKIVSNSKVNVFKDKAARVANPFLEIDSFHISFDMGLADSAKNCIKQSYLALKALDAYADYTDE